MRDIGRTLDDGADDARDLEHAANVRAVRGGGNTTRQGLEARDARARTRIPPSSRRASRRRALLDRVCCAGKRVPMRPRHHCHQGENGMRICLSRDTVIREHDVAREP